MSGNCDCGGPQLTRAAEQKAVSEAAAARSIIKIRGTGVGSDVQPMCQLCFLCLGTRPHLRRRILFFLWHFDFLLFYWWDWFFLQDCVCRESHSVVCQSLFFCSSIISCLLNDLGVPRARGKSVVPSSCAQKKARLPSSGLQTQ